jgi:hypothetical protein
MRTAVLLTALLLPAATAQAVVPAKQKSHPYRRRWKKATFGKSAAARVAAGAGVAQLRKSPRRWGGGASGFGKRLGAGFATHGVKTTVEHAVAGKLHESLDYQRSTKPGFKRRLGHALASTVIAKNTKTGKKTPAAGRLSGHAAAGAFTQGVLHAGAGASTAGIGLGVDAGANVAREFWPRKRAPAKRAVAAKKKPLRKHPT